MAKAVEPKNYATSIVLSTGSQQNDSNINKKNIYPGLDSEIVAELARIPDEISIGGVTLAREAALSKLEGTYDQFGKEMEKQMSPAELAVERQTEEEANVLDERIGEELEELERQRIQDMNRIKAHKNNERMSGIFDSPNHDIKRPASFVSDKQPDPSLKRRRSLLDIYNESNTSQNFEPHENSNRGKQTTGSPTLAELINSSHDSSLDEIVVPIMNAAIETPPRSPIIGPLQGSSEGLVLRTPRPLLPHRHTETSFNDDFSAEPQLSENKTTASTGTELNTEGNLLRSHHQ